MNAYFKEPYAADIQVNGFNSILKKSIDQVFSDAFKSGVNNGTEKEFVNAVADNDVFDWAPKTETQLYHGDADQLVCYNNSTTAEKAMQAKGGKVTLITTPGGDHLTTLQAYALGTLTFFEGKK